MSKPSLRHIGLLLALLLLVSACSNNESYSDRLNTERHAINAYLRTQRIENEIPKDSVFETGKDAPFYRLDPESNVYMQVIDAGDRENDKAKTGQTIYFRYTRYNLVTWYSTKTLTVDFSNELDVSFQPTYFQFKDFTMPASAQWGYGIQLPLNYLGAEAEVNLIIKSLYGITEEISYVQPYLIHVRYFHSMM